MEEKTIQHEVAVHKASITLADGESISQFTQRLSKDGKDYVAKKLNLATSGNSGNSLNTAKAYVYMCETYGDRAVFDVYKSTAVGGDSSYAYYGVEYARKSNGTFEFKNLTEVERVTSFQPKPSLALDVNKAAEPEAPASLVPSETDPFPGWTVKKSLFHGVI